MDAPRLPAAVEATAAELALAGLRVWVVGGALRDTLLERPVRDYDLVVSADLASAEAALPEAHRIGRHHPVLLLPAAGLHRPIEISALGEEPGALERDLARRDFTLNALALEIGTSELIDPHGGLDDLRAKRLRAVDPERSFADDPARVLRGVRLCAELELEPDGATWRAMQLGCWRLHAVAGERLRDELFRVLRGPRPSAALRELRRVGALPALLPELLRGVGIASAAGSHDAFARSLARCDALPAEPLPRLAALLVDSALAEGRRYLPGRDLFVAQHVALRAARRVGATARRLRLSRRQAGRLERLLRHHPLRETSLRTPAAIRRMLARVGRDILDDLVALRRAEGGSAGWDACEARVLAAAREQEGPVTRLAIGGKEIMQFLSLPEGPEVGRWLARARRRVVEHPAENERERLRAWLGRARVGS